jgi:hypothetical protein
MKLDIDSKKEYGQVVEEVTRFELWVTEDKRFSFFFNNQGELEVNKHTYNSESSTIVIKPSVSNHINII